MYQNTNYNDKSPHLFVWDVLERKVIRRFMPTIAPIPIQSLDSFFSESAGPLDSDRNSFKLSDQDS